MMNLQQILNFPNSPILNSNRDIFKTSLIGSSDCNEYIPYYAIFAHELIVINNTDVKVLEYSVPKTSNSVPTYRTGSHLVAAIKGNWSTGIWFTFSLQGVTHKIFVYRGLIMDHTGEILVCVGINKEYLMSTPYDEIKTINPSKYVLFISNKLNTDIYKNLKKRLEKEVFNSFVEGNVDIVYTNRIIEWLFKNNFKQPKFKSIKESAQHLKEVSKLLLKV